MAAGPATRTRNDPVRRLHATTRSYALLSALLLMSAPSSLAPQASRGIDDTATGAPVAPVRELSGASALSLTARIAVPVALFWFGMEADETVRGWAQGPGLQGNALIDGVTSAFNHVGTPWPLVVSGASYLAARAAGEPDVADFAWHVSASLFATSATTAVLKGVVGRARPYHTGEDSDIFDPGEGLSGNTHYNSFPSGHTATAFALAASLSGEVAHRWPRAGPPVRVATYAAAGITGFARVYRDKHWVTDVVVGALIGHWVGSRVAGRHEGSSPWRPLPFFAPGVAGDLTAGIALQVR